MKTFLTSLILVVTACGPLPAELQETTPQSPDVAAAIPTATPIPTAVPTATPVPKTVVRFTNFFSQNTFCSAMQSWNQSTTDYIFPASGTSGNLDELTFRDGLVYQHRIGVEPVSSDLIGNLGLNLHNSSPGCKIVVQAGAFVRVDP